MVEGLRRLAELSRLDGEIRSREDERAGLPAQQAACAKRRAALETRRAGAAQSLEEIRQVQRRQESLAADQEVLLERLLGQQNQVKTNEAYTALLHEMDAAREAISNAETAVLEAMEQLDRAGAELAAAQSVGSEEGAALDREEVAIATRESELEEQLAALAEERERVASQLEDRLRARYERVAAQRKPAIAVLDREICSGCRVGVPPQDYLEARNAESLVSCAQCNRILIHRLHLA